MALEQEGSEWFNDSLDKMHKLLEHANNRLTLSNHRLVERYMKGEEWLHLHLRSKRDASDFCFILNGAQDKGFRSKSTEDKRGGTKCILATQQSPSGGDRFFWGQSSTLDRHSR